MDGASSEALLTPLNVGDSWAIPRPQADITTKIRATSNS